MATDLQGELDSFSRFVVEHLQDQPPISLEESLEAYREYQQELERFRAESQSSLDQAARGEASPLDAEALKHRVRKRLAEKGIV